MNPEHKLCAIRISGSRKIRSGSRLGHLTVRVIHTQVPRGNTVPRLTTPVQIQPKLIAVEQLSDVELRDPSHGSLASIRLLKNASI